VSPTLIVAGLLPWMSIDGGGVLVSVFLTIDDKDISPSTD
jgi:hypothetical protein